MNLYQKYFVLTSSLFFVTVFLSQSYAVDIKYFNEKNHAKNYIENSRGLVQFYLKSVDYKVRIHDRFHFGTKMISGFKTEQISDIEKFGIVNFIKGEQYFSKEIDGRTVKEYSVDRRFFGSYKPYIHNVWEIDSIDCDPLFWSVEGAPSRHYGYKWNKVAGSHSKDTQMYYGRDYPTNPELYINDHPGQAFFDNGYAKNIKLEFKTCLYNIEDIPLVVLPQDINFAVPVKCFFWKSNFVYNHKNRSFE